MRKNTVCSILSKGDYAFRQIKNPHIGSKQDTPMDIHTKFGSNWWSSVRGEDFWQN